MNEQQQIENWENGYDPYDEYRKPPRGCLGAFVLLVVFAIVTLFLILIGD